MFFKDNFSAFKVNVNQVLVLAVICLIIIKLLQIFWDRRHLYRLSYQCGGDFAWPVVGNLFDFGTNGERWMGPYLCILVYDPDDIQIVLRHENSMSKPFVYQYAKDWVGDGIITADIPTWKKHRKIIAPTFNRSTLKNYMEIFKKQSDTFVQQVEKYSNSGKHFDVFYYVSRCTLDIIMESAMGVNIGSQTCSDGGYGDLYIKSTNRAFEILYERTMKIWYIRDEVFRFSNLSKEFKNCVDIFHKISNQVIEEKRPYYENKIKSNEKFEIKSRKTFIDEVFNQLENSNSEWTNKDVRDEISSMIAAGADTTAHSLSFVLLLLAMHPDIQEKVYEEIKFIDDLVGSSEDLNIDMAKKLVYMNQVILESLRIYPTSTMVGRYTTGDVQLKSKNIVIPKDVFVIVGFSMLQRSSKYWGPNAHKFDPENFSPENRSKRHPNAFVAFSDGPRNCVGLKFANLSMKMILYKFLKSYKVETEEKFEDIRCEFHLLMKKVGGCNIKISPRNQ